MDRDQDDCRARFQRWIEPLLEQAGAYAYSIVGNPPDAEDSVQEALWKGYRGMSGYDSSRPFKGWWFAILRNCCLDLLQSRSRQPRVLSEEEVGHRMACTNPQTEALRDSMASLAEPYREILRLRYFGGCSYRDLAESLSIPVGTVMSRLHAARQALAAEFAKE